MQLIDRIIEVDIIDSTQTLAKKIVEEKPQGNILILASSQTNGYGRRGNFWSSEKGGIYLTLITRMNFSDENISKLSLKVARALQNTLSEYSVKSKIKFPNDVLACVNKKYKKIAGILIEIIKNNDCPYVLFGIGINTNNNLPANLRKTAVSLKKILKREIDNKEFLKIFFEHFWSEIKTLKCSAG